MTSCGHQVTRLASGYSATSSSEATPSACARRLSCSRIAQARSAAARPGTPARGAGAARRRPAAGRRCAPRAGRCRGPTGRSPRSRRRASPGCRSPNSTISRIASAGARPGQQDAPQPGQEQQPDADRPVEPRQQQIGPPGRAAAAPPSRRRDIGVAGDLGCEPAWLLLCAPPCPGQSALFVATAAEPPAPTVAATRGAGALSRARACGAASGDPVHAVQRPRRRVAARIAAFRARPRAMFVVEHCQRVRRRQSPTCGWRSRC